MSDDNIKTLPSAAGLPENPLQIAQRPPGWCSHASVLLDQHTRTIHCADPKCGAALDAFDFLLSNAQMIERAWQNHHQVSRQAHEIADRVHVLKKEEQRLRAMIKRLQDKSGAVLTVRGKETL
jgi:hypothetical protein